MWQRPLTAAQQNQARRKILEIGQWLRNGEPAQSVSEDLLAHQLRSLLVALGNAVAHGRRTRTQRLVLAVERCVVELFRQRQQRKR